jgi:hypothetical protein
MFTFADDERAALGWMRGITQDPQGRAALVGLTLETRFCLHGNVLGWNCDACLPRCVGCGRLTDREILNDHGRCWRDDHGRCWLCRMIDNNFGKSEALRLKFKALFDGKAIEPIKGSLVRAAAPDLSARRRLRAADYENAALAEAAKLRRGEHAQHGDPNALLEQLRVAIAGSSKQAPSVDRRSKHRNFVSAH